QSLEDPVTVEQAVVHDGDPGRRPVVPFPIDPDDVGHAPSSAVARPAGASKLPSPRAGWGPILSSSIPHRRPPMATAEGRTIPFTGPEAIDVAVLETFPSDGPGQEIVTEPDEFSAVCPFSGLPDVARLTLSYVPGDRCIELK